MLSIKKNLFLFLFFIAFSYSYSRESDDNNNSYLINAGMLSDINYETSSVLSINSNLKKKYIKNKNYEKFEYEDLTMYHNKLQIAHNDLDFMLVLIASPNKKPFVNQFDAKVTIEAYLDESNYINDNYSWFKGRYAVKISPIKNFKKDNLLFSYTKYKLNDFIANDFFLVYRNEISEVTQTRGDLSEKPLNYFLKKISNYDEYTHCIYSNIENLEFYKEKKLSHWTGVELSYCGKYELTDNQIKNLLQSIEIKDKLKPVKSSYAYNFNIPNESLFVNENEEKNISQKQKQITIVSNEVDNINPSINCEDYSIFTEERSANVKCNIQDNDEILKVYINGSEVDYISELIDVDVNLRYGSQIIQVQAIDVSGNETFAEINANREFILAEEKKVIEPLNPGSISVPKNNNRIALVIGIKNYKDIDDTKYADTDAQTFIDFAIETLGIEVPNIKYFINDEAGFLDFATIDRWMKSKIKKDTEVFVFYSGHGANYKGEPLLLPADFRADLIENSSYNKKDFLENISMYQPKHIFAFFDACFSGLGREGETLIAGLRNISIVEEEVPFSGITIFNSSSGAEFSRDFDEAGHGLFSYFLMKGLEGIADLNNDKSITTEELYEFIAMNVSEQSLRLGIPQNPSLVSDDNRVIVKW